MYSKNPWAVLAAGLMWLTLGTAQSRAQGPDFESVPTSQQFFEQAVHDSEGAEWKPLFNGKNLDGWKVVLSNAAPGEDPEKIFQVADGMIHVYRDTPAGKKMPFGVILSDKAYSEYRFRFDFKWGEKKFAPRTEAVRDAGLLFHVVGPEKVWPMSVECQVQEKDVGDNFLVYTGGDAPVDASGKKFQDVADGGKWKPFFSKGGITRVVKSKTPEHAGWNTVEVIVRGDAAIYIVNGEINNYIVNMRAPIGPQGEVVPLTAGKLALQCEWAELFYKNVELLELKPRAKAVEKTTEGKTSATMPASSGSLFADESIAPVPPRSPEESLKSWRVRDGFRVDLVAAEPLVMDPVAIDWGMDGKLWIAEMADYPLGMDDQGKAGGRIRFLGKSQPDGPYDRSTLFLEGVNFPTGIVSWGKGVIVTAAPEIFYAEDTDGDGRCDLKKTLFSGFNEGNQQLRINSLRWGIDGWLHCASGGHHAGYGSKSRVHSHLTGEDLLLGSRDFRFHPVTGKLEPLSGPSQFGRNPDDYDNWFGVQNSYPLWHYVLEDHYLRRNPHFVAPDARQLLTEGNPRVFPVAEIGAQPNPGTRVGRFTSACSGMVYRDNLLPLELRISHAFTCEPVHNLVQHNLLARLGSSFTMRRDVEGETPDFLASTDTWSRPVMVRTGPDGALWVVDMYRYIIEHPEWVPASVQKEMKPFLRLGDGRGRIYRVMPATGSVRPVPNLSIASSAELVQFLDHPNSWVRDSAQRRLVELNDAALPRMLREFLNTATTIPGKLHAVSLLSIVGACDEELITLLLGDDAEDVRRLGLKLAEKLADPGADLLNKIAGMVKDPSDIVRLQLACSLGNLNHPQCMQALAEMWEIENADRFLAAALFSSLNEQNIAAVLAKVSEQSLQNETARKRYQQLVAISVAFECVEPVRAALLAQSSDLDNFIRTMTVLDVLYRNQSSSAFKNLDPAVILAIHERANALLEQEGVPNEVKTAAVFLLFDRPDSTEIELELARRLLSGTLPAPVQQALIRHLGEQPGLKYGELLLSGWTSYVPSVREQILEVLVSHPDWYPLLVEWIDQGMINPREINLSLQQRFLSHPKRPSVSELKKRFQLQSNVKANEEGLQAILELTGDQARGRLVFQKNCADCHRYQGEGYAVGPNLSSVTGRTPASLFDSIVDPSKAVEPKYLSYSIALKDGRILSGLIENDTGSGLTILKAKEEKATILRSEIDELRSTGKSLMPDGFEKTLQSQDLADLISYLQQTDGSTTLVH